MGADPNLIDGPGRHSALYAAFINDWEMVHYMLQRGSDYQRYSTGGADIAALVDYTFTRKTYTPDSENHQWLLKVKQYLVERDVVFPPPTPAEMRARWEKERKPDYLQ